MREDVARNESECRLVSRSTRLGFSGASVTRRQLPRLVRRQALDGRSHAGRLGFDLGGNGVPNPPQRWQDSEKSERTSIYDFLAIDLYRQLSITSFDERRFNAQFLPEEGRRTGGLNPRDSVAATTNRDQHRSTSRHKNKGPKQLRDHCWTPNAWSLATAR